VRQSPSPEALRWVERAVGRGARVAGSTRLVGGITAVVHRVAVVDRRGTRQQLVLRRWLDGIEHDEACALVAREAYALEALDGRGIPAPQLLAHDVAGVDAGAPALLMTRVPGRVDLTPRDFDAWLRQMAATLARIHALPIPAAPFDRWYDRDRAGVPPRAKSAVWRRAHDVARTDVTPDDQQTFIHRDYQHFNVLWRRGRLTGVVDWVNAAVGPPELDVGHCRLNLAVLFSAEWAERFRLEYEAAADRTLDPAWDITALLSYGPEWPHTIPIQVAGRASFDPAGVTSRVESLLAAAVRRL
jgi:aminoglycoside phosphotransferase (APT) family kinase protein